MSNRMAEVVWRNGSKDLFECASFRAEGNFIYLYKLPSGEEEKKVYSIIASDLVKSITALPEMKDKVKKVKKVKK